MCSEFIPLEISFYGKDSYGVFWPKKFFFPYPYSFQLLFNHKNPFQTTSKSCLFNLAYMGVLVDFDPSFTMKGYHKFFDQINIFTYIINKRT
ncbi:hypothetical protein HanPI659440_Chr11g0407781 [Helianthus annuus]|nr:hypothetical protein HanPI659440_Chr11g0407781 [Helianthus annuus]